MVNVNVRIQLDLVCICDSFRLSSNCFHVISWNKRIRNVCIISNLSYAFCISIQIATLSFLLFILIVSFESTLISLPKKNIFDAATLCSFENLSYHYIHHLLCCGSFDAVKMCLHKKPFSSNHSRLSSIDYSTDMLVSVSPMPIDGNEFGVMKKTNTSSKHQKRSKQQTKHLISVSCEMWTVQIVPRSFLVSEQFLEKCQIFK